MRIILLENVKKVGLKDEIIEVKDGYGNYLINQKLAVIANEKSLKALEKRQVSNQIYNSQMRSNAQLNKEKLEKQVFNIKISFNKQTQQINGAITKDMVIKAIQSKYPDIKIDTKDFISFPKTKLLQVYEAQIKLYKDIIAKIEFGVDI